MTGIRIAIAATLAVGALLAGSSASHRAAPARASVALSSAQPGGLIGCCTDD